MGLVHSKSRSLSLPGDTYMYHNLDVRPYVSFPDSLIQMLYRINFQLWEIIHQVIPQVKFAFRDDPMYLTYFLTKSRSNLVFAFLARIRAYFASLMLLFQNILTNQLRNLSCKI